MEIVGIEDGEEGERVVVTIDVWYSSRRRAWIVERLDRYGDQIGPSYRCADEEDAATCLAEWLRTHSETHVVSSRDLTAAERRILIDCPTRRAA